MEMCCIGYLIRYFLLLLVSLACYVIVSGEEEASFELCEHANLLFYPRHPPMIVVPVVVSSVSSIPLWEKERRKNDE